MRIINIQLVLLLCLIFTCTCFAAEYTVQTGDTLSSIAQKELGSSSRWKEIAEQNGLTKPYVINRGQVLRMPGDSVGDEEIPKELEEIYNSIEKQANQKPENKLFGGKVKPVWFLPAAGIGIIILIVLIIFLINSLALFIACKLMGIKGRYPKCFMVVFAAQGPCILLQFFLPNTFNPFMVNAMTALAVFYGGILLVCLIHVFLIKFVLDCKVSKSIASFCLMISLMLFIYMVIYLILAGAVIGTIFAKMS